MAEEKRAFRKTRVGKVVSDKKEFTNRVKTGLLISLGVYAILSAIILIFAEPLLSAMATSPDIIKESATYIRIESIANIFGILFSFVSVALISLGKDRFVYILTGIKLILCIVSDTACAISAKNKDIKPLLDELQKAITHIMGAYTTDSVCISNVRHYEALSRALEAIRRVKQGLADGISGEFLSMDLQDCLNALGEVTGQITSQDVLNNIFSKFCIGK